MFEQPGPGLEYEIPLLLPFEGNLFKKGSSLCQVLHVKLICLKKRSDDIKKA